MKKKKNLPCGLQMDHICGPFFLGSVVLGSAKKRGETKNAPGTQDTLSLESLSCCCCCRHCCHCCCHSGGGGIAASVAAAAYGGGGT